MGAALFCLFTDVAGGNGHPASRLASRADAQGDRSMGTSWLLTSFESCQLKAQV